MGDDAGSSRRFVNTSEGTRCPRLLFVLRLLSPRWSCAPSSWGWRSPTQLPMMSTRPSSVGRWPVIVLPDCGCDGKYRDTVTRPLTDLPVAGYLLALWGAVPRYRCTGSECGRTVISRDLGRLAAPRSSTTRRRAR